VLIRRMSQANSGRGAPRILGELAKLGIVVAETNRPQVHAPPP